jgi:uncharacterized protein
MRFWDSSAIVPLCINEPASRGLLRLLRDDAHILVWWSTPVECSSAFARRRREGGFSPTEERQARRALDTLALAWTEMEPSREIRDGALRGLAIHPLAAADALQLSAAQSWADHRPGGRVVVCLDDRLRAAAQAEGFDVLP